MKIINGFYTELRGPRCPPTEDLHFEWIKLGSLMMYSLGQQGAVDTFWPDVAAGLKWKNPEHSFVLGSWGACMQDVLKVTVFGFLMCFSAELSDATSDPSSYFFSCSTTGWQSEADCSKHGLSLLGPLTFMISHRFILEGVNNNYLLSTG